MSIISKEIKKYDYKKINIFLNKVKKKAFQKNLVKKKINFHLPSILKLKSKTHQRLKDYFKKDLLEYKKVKILYGLYKTHILKNFVKKHIANKKNRYRFLIENEFSCLLERRLDVLLYRSHFLKSLTEAKQIISHGKFFINGKKTKIFSIILKKGEIISIDKKFQKILKINVKNQLFNKLLSITKTSFHEINWTSLRIIFVKLRAYIPKNFFIFTSLLNWNTIITTLKSN